MIRARWSPSPCHAGTGAGRSSARAPSETSMPITAWSSDFAIDHESRGVTGVTTCGSATKLGSAPS